MVRSDHHIMFSQSTFFGGEAVDSNVSHWEFGRSKFAKPIMLPLKIETIAMTMAGLHMIYPKIIAILASWEVISITSQSLLVKSP